MKYELILVDDDDVAIFLHEKMLQKSDFQRPSYSFANGRLALDFIVNKANPEVMYFILLDINMPIMNGWEFLEAVKKVQAPLKMHVIMLTSSANNDDRLKAGLCPLVINYLEKPVNTETFKALKKTKEFLPYFA
jgi:CheY-like chemotaxis protein